MQSRRACCWRFATVAGAGRLGNRRRHRRSAACDRELRIAVAGLLDASAKSGLFHSHILSMVHFSHEAQRSASTKQNATPSASQVGTLSDGYLSVQFSIRTDAHGRTALFAQPQQQYDNGDGRTFHSPAIHQDDLFRMAILLMKASGYISTLKNPMPSDDASEDSEDVVDPVQDDSSIVNHELALSASGLNS